MIRGQQPNLWLLFVLRLKKCFKLRYLLIIFFLLIFFTYLRLFNSVPDQLPLHTPKSVVLIQNDITLANYPHLNQCNFDQTETILQYKSPTIDNTTDNRAKPTIERLNKLFQLLISHEEKNRPVFDYLNIFRFTDIHKTLHVYANNTQRLENIYCHFQRYITISDQGHIEINPELITYLKQVSTYLSDGFKNEHTNWKVTSKMNIEKPVIILAANAHFYDTLQASMKTVNSHLMNYSVAIYDLGFNQKTIRIGRIEEIDCLK